MPVEIHIKLGSMLVRVMGDDLKSVMPGAAFLGEVAVRCKGRQNVAFLYRNPKSFDYYGVVDLDTGDELLFGQKKETKELFLRHDSDWKPAYSGGQSYGEDQGEPGEPVDQEPPSQPPPRSAPPQRAPAQQPQRPPATQQRPPSQPGERKWKW